MEQKSKSISHAGEVEDEVAVEASEVGEAEVEIVDLEDDVEAEVMMEVSGVVVAEEASVGDVEEVLVMETAVEAMIVDHPMVEVEIIEVLDIGVDHPWVRGNLFKLISVLLKLIIV